MWKTRFEVSTSNNKDFIRHPTRSPSSTLSHRYSRPSPTVPRVREDSPSAIIRPSPPSSIPNLESLAEEDEDLPYSTSTNNEQPSSISTSARKQSSYQTILPTIIESHDHEAINDEQFNINMTSRESNDDRHQTYLVKHRLQDSIAATNTNYNQANIERPIHTNTPSGLTINKRINKLLQDKNQRKFTSLSADIDEHEMSIPSTFKDISAFFEEKTSTMKTNEQKKIVRAKRLLSLTKYVLMNNHDSTKSESMTSCEEESSLFSRQIKRIKKTHHHQSSLYSITKPEPTVNDSLVERSSDFDRRIGTNEYEKKSKQSSMYNISSKRWFILLLVPNMIFVYFCLSHLITIDHQYNPSVHRSNDPPRHLIHHNLISQYGQFIRNYFFSLLDLLVTFISQILFRIEKYEYKHNIVYVTTSTYEQIYDWLIHSFK